MDQREFKIGALAGDGIRAEITDAAIEVLHAASELTGLKLRLFSRTAAAPEAFAKPDGPLFRGSVDRG